MKLQNLIIIFIIIIIPIILIFSYYLGLEADTIRMQTDYDEKLIEATREAVEAFEINTIEWNSEYSTLANSKRRDLLSSINVFTTSLANKLGIAGTSKENILNYAPAIVYIMYDGYYIYSPTHVPQTITDENGLQLYYYNHADIENPDEYITTKATQIKTNTSETIPGEPMYVGNTLTKDYNGEPITFTTNIEDAQKTYKHVLKTFVPYTSIKGDYVINYTLDNYVRVYGEESQEGYVADISEWNITPNSILVTLVSGSDKVSIGPETLTENIAIRDSKDVAIAIENYTYVYNSNNEKRYYDDDENKFFSIDNYYVKNYNLPHEYKKVLILPEDNVTKYVELYQKLNGDDTFWYYKTGENEYVKYSYQPSINKNQDCSAINYYIENYCFNNWLDDNDIDIDVTNKNDKIIENINTNLNLAISNYSANSGMNYTIPELSPTDWEQALSNISMITFFQGAKIGLKTYNNYAIVTSTENNEYVAEDSLYYGEEQDTYYHRYGCSSTGHHMGETGGYRNIEFKVQNYTYKNDEGKSITNYYYKHTSAGTRECFDCIVNRNNMNKMTNEEMDDKGYDEWIRIYNTALARERYIQMSRTRLTDYNARILEPEDNTETQECTHSNTSIQYNSTEHWYVCDDCNSQVGGIQSHTLKYTNKIAEPLVNYGHIAECEHCGYSFNEPCKGEDWEYYSRDAHAGTCALCKVDMWQAHQKLNNQTRCFICQ